MQNFLTVQSNKVDNDSTSTMKIGDVVAGSGGFGGYRQGRRGKVHKTSTKSNQSTLNFDQIRRLYHVMDEELQVHGRGNFPTLFLALQKFVPCLMQRLENRGLIVKRVKLNGGAASYVLATKILPYNDVDLIFDVQLDDDDVGDVNEHDSDVVETIKSTTKRGNNDVSQKFDEIKCAVLETLIEFLPQHVNRSKMTCGAVQAAYVRKMVKVGTFGTYLGRRQNDSNVKMADDVWSLISLNNAEGRFLELKFVDRMRRQFEFSVDSFQIDLAPVLISPTIDYSNNNNKTPTSPFAPTVVNRHNHIHHNHNHNHHHHHHHHHHHRHQHHQHNQYHRPSTPLIKAESLFGDFHLALRHLNQMLIDTVQPELIRGGGLLKYVNLLVKGYKTACGPKDALRMERYMCSRFFIDYPTCQQQERKLRAYLDNHFIDDDLWLKRDFLFTLHSIIDESTVCLMNHELRQSLGAVERLTFEVQSEIDYCQNGHVTAFMDYAQNSQMIMAMSPLAVAGNVTSSMLPISPWMVTSVDQGYPYLTHSVAFESSSPSSVTAASTSNSHPCPLPSSMVNCGGESATSSSSLLSSSSSSSTTSSSYLRCPSSGSQVSATTTSGASSAPVTTFSDDDVVAVVPETILTSAPTTLTQTEPQRPLTKPMLLYVPNNGSFWMPVM